MDSASNYNGWKSKEKKEVQQKGFLDFYKEFNSTPYHKKKKKEGFLSLLSSGGSNTVKTCQYLKACKEYCEAYDQNIQKSKHQKIQEEFHKIKIEENAERVAKQKERNAARMKNPEYKKIAEEIDEHMYREVFQTGLNKKNELETYTGYQNQKTKKIDLWLH